MAWADEGRNGAWGFVRTGAIISFSIAPIVLALVYARLRSHRLGLSSDDSAAQLPDD